MMIDRLPAFDMIWYLVSWCEQVAPSYPAKSHTSKLAFAGQPLTKAYMNREAITSISPQIKTSEQCDFIATKQFLLYQMHDK